MRVLTPFTLLGSGRLGGRVSVLPLHGSLSLDEQQRVFLRPQDGYRKVPLSLGGVTVVLQWCHTAVTAVLPWCHSSVTVVLK
jgi:hypothetical protein